MKINRFVLALIPFLTWLLFPATADAQEAGPYVFLEGGMESIGAGTGMVLGQGLFRLHMMFGSYALIAQHPMRFRDGMDLEALIGALYAPRSSRWWLQTDVGVGGFHGFDDGRTHVTPRIVMTVGQDRRFSFLGSVCARVDPTTGQGVIQLRPGVAVRWNRHVTLIGNVFGHYDSAERELDFGGGAAMHVTLN